MSDLSRFVDYLACGPSRFTIEFMRTILQRVTYWCHEGTVEVDIRK